MPGTALHGRHPAVSATATKHQPPHIIFALADDVGYGDVGWMADDVLSPNLDALAKEGLRLGRHYSYMWCAPSRAAMLSGRLPANMGVYGESGSQYAGPDPSIQLLPAKLKKAGYVTHGVGSAYPPRALERPLPSR